MKSLLSIVLLLTPCNTAKTWFDLSVITVSRAKSPVPWEMFRSLKVSPDFSAIKSFPLPKSAIASASAKVELPVSLPITKISSPLPPVSVSCPLPAYRRSFPLPPKSLSLPVPPRRVSLPFPPSSWSSPLNRRVSHCHSSRKCCQLHESQAGYRFGWCH